MIYFSDHRRIKQQGNLDRYIILLVKCECHFLVERNNPHQHHMMCVVCDDLIWLMAQQTAIADIHFATQGQMMEEKLIENFLTYYFFNLEQNEPGNNNKKNMFAYMSAGIRQIKKKIHSFIYT